VGVDDDMKDRAADLDPAPSDSDGNVTEDVDHESSSAGTATAGADDPASALDDVTTSSPAGLSTTGEE
jgi:hypothetical protein